MNHISDTVVTALTFFVVVLLLCAIFVAIAVGLFYVTARVVGKITHLPTGYERGAHRYQRAPSRFTRWIGRTRNARQEEEAPTPVLPSAAPQDGDMAGQSRA